MSKKITRRQFLKRSAAAAATAAVAPHLRLIPGTNVSYAAGPGDAIVVYFFLDGVNDGLNTVYPLSDGVGGNQRAKYEEYRPTLALPDTTAGLQPWIDAGFYTTNGILELPDQNADGNTYALHPTMKLHVFWETGNRLTEFLHTRRADRRVGILLPGLVDIRRPIHGKFVANHSE